ncbi:MAG TPA: glycosyltransferase family 4 protein [Azospira sp.]|nr:glycosyltransferase family 4 protein [Azospira sp.]
MKLLLLSQYFWPETFGINALAKALVRNGHAVTALTGQPNYPEGKVFPGYSAWQAMFERYEGVDILRLPLVPRGKRSALRLAMNYVSFILSALMVGPLMLRRRKFDAVFVYAPSPLLQALPAIFISWYRKVPLVVWVQDLWPESLAATGFVRNEAVLRWVARVVRYLYRHTDLILVPSVAFIEPIVELGGSRDRIVYFPNAYIPEQVVSAECAGDATALVERIASGFSVVFAGNLGVAQSLETVLDAAERLQVAGVPVRFFLVGSGSRSERLNDQILQRKLTNVELPGRFPPESMGLIYAAASALLVSLRDEPIFAMTIPSKVQGYLAAGRPIIASLNGEGARVIREANAGFACPAGDGGALAAAITNLFHLDKDARRELGENGRLYAEQHFSLDRLALELIRRLERVQADCRRNSR